LVSRRRPDLLSTATLRRTRRRCCRRRRPASPGGAWSPPGRPGQAAPPRSDWTPSRGGAVLRGFPVVRLACPRSTRARSRARDGQRSRLNSCRRDGYPVETIPTAWCWVPPASWTVTVTVIRVRRWRARARGACRVGRRRTVVVPGRIETARALAIVVCAARAVTVRVTGRSRKARPLNARMRTAMPCVSRRSRVWRRGAEGRRRGAGAARKGRRGPTGRSGCR
jgi:hypothetical protein